MQDTCILSTELLRAAANIEETAYKLYRGYCLKWRSSTDAVSAATDAASAATDAASADETQQLLSDIIEEFRLMLSCGQDWQEDTKRCMEAQIRAMLRVQQTLKEQTLRPEPASDPAQDAAGEFGHFDTAHSVIVDILLQSIKLRKDAAKDASKGVLENCMLLVENVHMALQTHTRERDVFEHGTFVLFKRVQQHNIVLMKQNATQLTLIDSLQTTICQQKEKIEKMQENDAFCARMQQAFSEHHKKQKVSLGDM
jgi:hypothetical protein